MMKRVLMVCLGNICRSPTAEAILRHRAEELGLRLEVDSAGTLDHHTGERSDPRSIRHAEARGYQMTHLARQIRIDDFHEFDLILTMDRSNFLNVSRLRPASSKAQIVAITDFHPDDEVEEIPDPYTGGPNDFEEVLDLLETCVDQLLRELKKT